MAQPKKENLIFTLKEKPLLIIFAIIGIFLLAIIINPAILSPKKGGLTQQDKCIVLPDKYCSSGKGISYLELEPIGFNLPEGTPIYAPFDGVFTSYGVSPTFETHGIISSDSKDGITPGISLTFVTEFNSSISNGTEVKKGQIVGTVGKTIIDGASNSNLIVIIQGLEPNGPAFNDPKLYGQIFKHYKAGTL